MLTCFVSCILFLLVCLEVYHFLVCFLTLLILLLCISLTNQKPMFCFYDHETRAGICLSYTTFNTSSILSFTSASDSRLYSCSNLVLERLLSLSIKWMDRIVPIL